ncbi:L,D-transpeptidase family protein [Stakelama saccharophila]|uniref:L,D-transpeptidase family protein n=1 Tax=Stakelama saccharophila TaxID=3075605 RepID=A0ABZ0BBM3_9SPHN|nr:L,D-transpeptidase family protein [Stakelama sp. W311]WNO54831.1 L,D-transpeptidase family protein [Stakelama sp. W311]
MVIIARHLARIGHAALLAAIVILGTFVAGPVFARPASAGNFTVRTMLQIDGELPMGGYMWSDAGVPDGEMRIVVDLANETLHVYRAGNEIGRSTLIYGDDRKPTPHGSFTILQKDADHVSNIYKGAPMPYMMKLTTDGVALHGSAQIESDIATHGCVGLPEGFARILFEHARLGDKVFITDDWMTGEYAGY